MNDAQLLLPAPIRVCPEPVPYQLALRGYLKSEEPDLWSWFSSNRVRGEHSDKVRLDLLKSTYRIERETQPALYHAADSLISQFDVGAPITFYQSQSAGELNASLAFVPGEVHIVLHGAVVTTLGPVE